MLIKILKLRGAQVAISIVLYLAFAARLPLELHQGLFAISLLIKDLLLWILPITVSFFIASSIASFEKKAPLFVLSLFLFELLSNSLSVLYSYGCGAIACRWIEPVQSAKLIDDFAPLWRLGLQKPIWWSADKGSFAGLVMGLVAAFMSSKLKAWIFRVTGEPNLF